MTGDLWAPRRLLAADHHDFRSAVRTYLELFFDGVRLGPEHLLGTPGGGFMHIMERLPRSGSPSRSTHGRPPGRRWPGPSTM
jgi:hypothetical protein